MCALANLTGTKFLVTVYTQVLGGKEPLFGAINVLDSNKLEHYDRNSGVYYIIYAYKYILLMSEWSVSYGKYIYYDMTINCKVLH